MSDISSRIDDRLNQIFNFKREGDWYRSGICPQCSKKECWTHALTPKVVKCGRLNNCGYEEHVKDICEDLFKDWSKEFQKTKQNPHAAADAYLAHGRGLDISSLKGLYTQETFSHEKKYPGLYTGTVRFKLAEGIYWERFIDRPERFGRQKANFIGKYEGLAWTLEKLDKLCNASSIWITEGIFNAIALTQAGQIAVSCMASGNYPSILLQQIEDRCHELKKDKPRLIWAFDNDSSGKKATSKFHLKALQEKWSSSAALPPAQVKGKNLDWNDLLMHDLLHSDERKKYKHYGEVFIAETAELAGLLIYNYKEGRQKSFFFEHNYHLYSFNLDYDKYNKALDRIERDAVDNPHLADMLDDQKREQALRDASAVTEIANRILTPLYMQRNEITKETFYYVQVSNNDSSTNLTFSPEQIRNEKSFSNHLLSLRGAWWTGNQQQLINFIKPRTENIKEVKTIDFIGYSKEFSTYIFNDYAIHEGKVIPINKHDYFTIKRKDIKTLATEDIKINPSAFKPTWWDDFYKVTGDKGLIVLAWWTGSYFAEQIREITGSYTFMELVGQAGAGKSSLLELLWKFSGRKDYEGFDPNKGTLVGVYRSLAQLSNLPSVLIESDLNDQNGNTKQRKFSWDELKVAFNGRPIRTIGMKTGGNETYSPPFRGAIMISQNTPIEASEAMLTRTILVQVDRKGQTLQSKNIADRLYRMPIEDASTYMPHCLRKEKEILETYKEKLAGHESQYHEAGIKHTRIALCHAQIAALIEALAEHVLEGVLDYEEVASAQDMLLTLAQDRVDQLNGDCAEVEQFFDAFEYLQSTRSAAFSLNHHDENAQTIAINLNEIYKVAAKSWQQLPDINTMKRLLKGSQKYKFIEANRAVGSFKNPADDAQNLEELKKRTVKCWIFTNPYFNQSKGNK